MRVSALRALGAYLNVFSIESFMDELAQAAGMPIRSSSGCGISKTARARDVIATAARTSSAGITTAAAGRRGRGFAFARYKNYAAYCAVAMEVEVERETGRVRLSRAVAAVDSGEVVNPDGHASTRSKAASCNR